MRSGVSAWWLTAALGLAALASPPTTPASPPEGTGAVELREAPHRFHFEPPVYPHFERMAEVEADVTVQVGVDSSGAVFQATPRGPTDPPLMEAAAEAVRKWRYEPSSHVTRWFSVIVKFRLPHKAIHKMPADGVVAQFSGAYAGRSEALRELEDRGGEAILPALLRELRHADLERRCGAGYLAGRLGEAAKSASGLLLDLVREVSALEKPGFWCISTGSALKSVDGAAFLAELDRAVRLRNGALCRQLLRSGDYHRDVPALVFDALELDGCREAAAQSLAFLNDASALPRLLRAAGQTSPVVRGMAMGVIAPSLNTLTGEDKRQRIAEAMPVLISGLQDPDRAVRSSAADALGMLKGDASKAVPALARALDDPSRDVRWRVLLALIPMGSQARAAGPALLKARASPLPPKEDERSLSDEYLKKRIEEAIATTGAGKDETQLAAEDEVRATVAASIVARTRAIPGYEKRGFSVMVFREESPPGLVAALGRRGLTPSPRSRDGLRIAFREVAWKAADLAALSVETRSGEWDDMPALGYNVALRDGVWTVVR